MLELGDHAMLMLPIIACAEAEEVKKLLEGKPRDMRDHMGRAHHHIPEAVCAIRDFWRERALLRTGAF
jgi:hypothetical protein